MSYTPTTNFYRCYVVSDCDNDGIPIPGTESVCSFSDSNTVLGIWIDNRLVLSREEAEEQIDRWNEREPELMAVHFYSLYQADYETGTTPPLPGMSDRDIARASRLRVPASVGHVIGQGGDCWCGEWHLESLPGDPVSLGPAFGGSTRLLASG